MASVNIVSALGVDNPLKTAQRVVIKIGSALLVDAQSGQLRTGWLKALAKDIAAQKQQGRDVVVVSSGSIALGRRVLGLPDGALPLDQAQAAAAVGQIRLARAYEEFLAPYGINTAQVLLTLDDSANRRRYLNSRATFGALLSHGVVPIVNENDTVATDEIRFGDNDRLAAQVASMAGADVLVLLSDVDGFYSANPKTDPTAQKFETVTEITPELEAMAGDAGTAAAKGGMKTKLMAAKTAMRAGCAMAIMEGNRHEPLAALQNGTACSWFLAATNPQAARKQWIAGMKPRGTIVVDAGAVAALQSGKSLLSAGVVAVTGTFERGDPVRIADAQNNECARGLIGYSSSESKAISGCHSAEIASVLGYAGRAALVHRDDMVI
ncbi:MAG: glutamate 5-kinase [Rhodobacteraceae bacterium]|nr:glutamate 5-kinase [Paracoccaceae bacterium]